MTLRQGCIEDTRGCPMRSGGPKRTNQTRSHTHTLAFVINLY